VYLLVSLRIIFHRWQFIAATTVYPLLHQYLHQKQTVARPHWYGSRRIDVHNKLFGYSIQTPPLTEKGICLQTKI
jgi:hypothetical protein